MNIENLVKMANEIGLFFAAEADRDQAAKDMASHLQKFWEPRMRARMLEHYAQGGKGLESLPMSAIGMLKSPPPPGG